MRGVVDYHFHVDDVPDEFGKPHSDNVIELVAHDLSAAGVRLDELGMLVHNKNYTLMLKDRVRRARKPCRVVFGVEVGLDRVEDVMDDHFLMSDVDYLTVSEERPYDSSLHDLKAIFECKRVYGVVKPVVFGHPQAVLLQLSEPDVIGLLGMAAGAGVVFEYNPGNFMPEQKDVPRLRGIYEQVVRSGIPVVYGSDAHDLFNYGEKWAGALGFLSGLSSPSGCPGRLVLRADKPKAQSV